MVTTKRQSVGVGIGVIGGAILWAYTNLGVMFFALLALLFLNLIAALWEKDALQMVHKWLRLMVGVVVPAIVPSFAHSANVAWSMADTRWIIASIFAALLAATLPDLQVFFNKTWTVLFGASATSKSLEAAVEARVQQELAKLQLQARQTIANPTIGITPATTNTLVNPSNNGSSGGQ